jgi:hypothetical protein
MLPAGGERHRREWRRGDEDRGGEGRDSGGRDRKEMEGEETGKRRGSMKGS